MSWLNQVIKKHKPKSGEASIFGVLLFTNAHPHISKVVYDDTYWRALDEISGEKWAIFCTKAEQGTISYPSPPPGVMAYMAPVWKEPNSNKDLLKTFDLKSTESLPSLLIFTIDKHGECLKNQIRLSDSSQEEAYKSLEKTIKVVTDAIDGVDPGNINNPDGVHSAVSFAIQNAKDWDRVKNGIKFWQWLKSII